MLPDPNDVGIYCVEAHRLAGNHWEFRGIWASLRTSIRDLIDQEPPAMTQGTVEEQIEIDSKKIIF